MWSYVARKSNPRWLWYAIDHCSGKVLAYVFGTRKDEVFIQLKALLKPFGITRFYTDGWGAYERHLESGKHVVGKQNTQKIENKNLNLRTRIKRLAAFSSENNLFFQNGIYARYSDWTIY